MGHIFVSFGIIIAQAKLKATSWYLSDEKNPCFVLTWLCCSDIDENVNSVRVGNKVFGK